MHNSDFVITLLYTVIASNQIFINNVLSHGYMQSL
jgi:hypothetical protein